MSIYKTEYSTSSAVIGRLVTTSKSCENERGVDRWEQEQRRERFDHVAERTRSSGRSVTAYIVSSALVAPPLDVESACRSCR